MPRLARTVSSSGFYHVVVRGDGKRILFESDSDRRYFLKLLNRYGKAYGLEYLAWCLMDNHVHLLVCDPENALSQAMHDLCGVYAHYYNTINEHVGSVFQSRFTSQSIENERYLLEVMRYIHSNPVRAGISGDMDYPWSSFDEYLRGGGLTNTELILDLVGGVEGFRDFCSRYDEGELRLIDKEVNGRITDSDALELAKCLLGQESVATIESQGKQERNNKIAVLLKAGLPIRQIARITGVGRGIIARVKAQEGTPKTT